MRDIPLGVKRCIHLRVCWQVSTNGGDGVEHSTVLEDVWGEGIVGEKNVDMDPLTGGSQVY